ncbi:MAG: NADH-quinone oxidoreductase subunit C, partial [Syntrophothermus sp.]
MSPNQDIVSDLRQAFPDAITAEQVTADGTPTVWIHQNDVKKVLRHVKCEIPFPYDLLYDITAIDERKRVHREGQPPSDFTVVYLVTSLERNQDLRIKLALQGEFPVTQTITDLWVSANWYECEIWDMFGIKFEGHPHLRRLLMPPEWQGYPLRKDHPARRTEYGPFVLSDEMREVSEDNFRFDPEYWGLKKTSGETDFMFLNIGPQHPGTHGLLRLILQLDGEDIVDIVPDIGYHHRGAEKMAERQTWHKYIPYTDRVDYLSGVINNLAYLLSVEKLAGIEIPPRAQVIRVLMCELFRIQNHLVWLGTFAQDLGQLSPVFFAFNDREKAFDLVMAVTGGRMHP